MKKTTITLLALCVMLFVAVGAQAQDASSVKANLLEVEANLADLQLRFPDSPDIPAFQEKRDYLVELLEELTVNGSTGTGTSTGNPTGNSGAQLPGNSDATGQEPASQAFNPSANQVSIGSDQQEGYSVHGSLQDLLIGTQNRLDRLQRNPNTDPATIKAYQKRVSALKTKIGNSN